MMRADEEFTKEAIEGYLRGSLSDFIIKEGEDPPDYYVHFGTKKIPLEITQSMPLYVQDGAIKNRTTIDEFLLRLCDELNDKYESLIPVGTSLLLYIEGPIDKGKLRNFKKILSAPVQQ